MHSGVKPLTGYLGNQFSYLIYFFKKLLLQKCLYLVYESLMTRPVIKTFKKYEKIYTGKEGCYLIFQLLKTNWDV